MHHTHFPRIESHLPNVVNFAKTLAHELDAGRIRSWTDMAKKVHIFFNSENLDSVERIIPGWHQMSSYANGVTLVHVMSALAAMFLSPEYKNIAEHQQSLMKWIVLLHDVDKKVYSDRRDLTHAFRSAAKACEIIARLGFGVTDQYEVQVGGWVRLTESATVTRRHFSIPDNSRLPEIVGGLDEIFGKNTPAALVAKTILFHHSVDAVNQWPQAAPLDADDIKKYIGFELLPLLKLMMLADSEAWNLFDSALRKALRGEILLVFQGMESRMVKKPPSVAHFSRESMSAADRIHVFRLLKGDGI